MNWKTGLPEKSGMYVAKNIYGTYCNMLYIKDEKRFTSMINDGNLNRLVDKWVHFDDFMKAVDDFIEHEEKNENQNFENK